jgi:6,7-dimethyl-8-ribityllumazine synthase
MALTDPDIKNWPDNIAKECTIAVVTSRFNAQITQQLKDICVQTLRQYGVEDDHLVEVDVPGALEVPLAASVIANGDTVDGIIALGCVMRGDTFHFEIVSRESARGLMNIQLEYCLPVINGILTVDNEAQANARIRQKAIDAATGAIEMILWRQTMQPGLSGRDIDML